MCNNCGDKKTAAMIRAAIGAGIFSGTYVDFAASLCSQVERGYALSEKQRHHFAHMSERAKGVTSEKFPRIVALLKRAQGKVKFAKVRLSFAHGVLIVSMNFRTGVVYINDRDRKRWNERAQHEQRVTYGRIDESGVYVPNTFNASFAAEVLETLRAFEQDAHKVARMEGHATSACCFCGRGLDTAESVTAGYGPICANRYGLPWGAKLSQPELISNALSAE